MSKYTAYLCIVSILGGLVAAFFTLVNPDYTIWGVGVLMAAVAVLMLA